MACPFFMPTQKCEAALWQHPSRLPLGAGWEGRCCSPGHENSPPNTDELDGCNMGYAANCSRLPDERSCDAVRFGIAGDSGLHVQVFYVCEAKHLPVAHGTLDYDVGAGAWVARQPDERIQKMAECYLQAYTMRKQQNSTSSSTDER